jgi:iron(II)-dependent oxidoreductase
MAGNVLEWVNDWYQYDYYSVSATNDPPGPATGYWRMYRGGSWADREYFLRVAIRNEHYPEEENAVRGFRCARGGAYGP